MNENYVVICLNFEKVGCYIFKKFDKNKRPLFNPNHALSDYHIYKSKSAANRTRMRLEEHYAYNPSIKTKVLSLDEWNENKFWEKMKKFFEK